MNISAYPMTKRQSAKKDNIQRKYDAMTTLRSLAKFTSSSLKMSRNFHKRTHFEKKKKKSDSGKSQINPKECCAYTKQQ